MKSKILNILLKLVIAALTFFAMFRGAPVPQNFLANSEMAVLQYMRCPMSRLSTLDLRLETGAIPRFDKQETTTL